MADGKQRNGRKLNCGEEKMREEEKPEEKAPLAAEKKEAEFQPIITDASHAMRVLEENGIAYEGEIELNKIGFCKLEAQQGCLMGTFCIPKLLDLQGSRYRILFFINSTFAFQKLS